MQGIANKGYSQNTVYAAHYNSSNFVKTIDLTKPVGIVAGGGQVNGSGASSYSIPIEIPVGTNGIIPNIELAYNSQGASSVGGYGWGMTGMSVITRINKNFYNDGVIKNIQFTNDDDFAIDGNRLILQSGVNGANGTTYVTQDETYSVLTSYGSNANGPQWFEIVAKDGSIMQYGNSTTSAIYNSGTLIYWRLNKVIDKNGNYYEFVYDNSDNDSRIKEINYTGNQVTGLVPYNKILFNYTVRLDQNTNYQGGLEFNQKYLLSEILITGESNANFKTYTFKHSYDGMYSYLAEVKEVGSDGTEVNSTIFKYGDLPQDIESEQYSFLVNQTGERYSGDFNGDGFDDILFCEITQYPLNNNWIKNPTSFTIWNRSASSPIYTQSGNITQLTGNWEISEKNPYSSNNSIIQDFDGDGRSEILMSKTTEILNSQGNSTGNRELNNVRIFNPAAQNFVDYLPLISTTILDVSGNPSVFKHISSFSGNYITTGDFDGDGRADFITYLFNGEFGNPVNANAGAILYTRPNVVGGENNMVEHIGPFGGAMELAGADQIYSIDFNGDGKSDIMTISGGDCKVYELIVNPNGGNPYKLNLLHASGYPTVWHNVFFGDFNGDRKTDLLTIAGNGTLKHIAYSTGIGWVTSPIVFNTPLLMHDPMIHSDNKILIGDFNGDGKSDITHNKKINVGGVNNTTEINTYFSTGNGFYYQQYVGNGILTSGTLMGLDMNGDGRTEILSQSAYTSPFRIFKLKPNGTERMLHKVTNGVNLTTVFNYEKLTSEAPFYTKGLVTPYPLNTIQPAIYNVSHVVNPIGIGGYSIMTYQYEGARFHRGGRGFLGYTKMISSNTTSDTRSIVENQFNANYYIPLQYKNSLYKLSSNVLLSIQTSNQQVIPISGSGNRFRIELSSINTYNALQNVTKTTNNTYDNYGNVIESTSTINTWETTKTETTFGAFGSTIPYLPIATTTTLTRAFQPSVSKKTTFTYNSLGLLTQKIDFDGLADAITTSIIYNAYGSPINETLVANGMSPRSVAYTYDPKNRFVLTNEKLCSSCGVGFSQLETYEYFPMWGVPSSYVSSDCQLTTYKIDGFGRAHSTKLPAGITVTNTLGWGSGGSYISWAKTTHPGKPDQTVWLDILGRTRKTETELMNGQIATTETSYNNKGLKATETNSFINGLEIPIVQNFTYDSYDRISSESNGLNTSNYTYTYNTTTSRLEVLKTDLSGKQQKTTIDPTGKTIKVEDPGGRIEFKYDSWGNQYRTDQTGLTVSLKKYDEYNRQIMHKELNAGEILYNYNAFGEMTTQVDASGNSYTFNYDNLGRLVDKMGPEGTTTYEYYCKSDGPLPQLHSNLTVGEPQPDPIGKSCCNNNFSKITGYNGIVQTFLYDNNARLTQKNELVDGVTYVTKYSYDANDNLLSTIYPSGLQINNTYDANSYLLFVKKPSAVNSIYKTIAMNGSGQITKYLLGNGKTTNPIYTNLLLTQINTPQVQHYAFSWNFQTGNLTGRKDMLKNVSETFTYDNLDRLTSAKVAGQITQNFQYDPAPQTGSSNNNMKMKDDAGYYRYTAVQQHTQSSIANFTSTILPPPNISTNEQVVNYTGFQRVDKISENGFTQRFEYWPGDDRVKSILSQNGNLIETRLYFGDYEKQTIAGNTTKEIHYISGAVGISAVIVLDGSTENTYYVYKDHLGSLSTITNTAGTVLFEQNFDAWGRNRNPNTWTYAGISTAPTWLYRGYTGHESMPQFGLINMNARLYDPVVGKMISPDNYVSNPNHTQSYNRYAYANSNPMKFVDPDGNFAFLPILIGAAVGAYSGGMMANGGEMDPTMWHNQNTARYIALGGLLGGISGHVGASISAMPIPAANTLGILSSSIVNSIGTAVYSNSSAISFSLGFASYDFESNSFNGIWNWKELSTLEKIGYTAGALANIQDLFAWNVGGDVTNNSSSPFEGTPHSWNSGDGVNISADKIMKTPYPTGWTGKAERLAFYAKYWSTHIKPGEAIEPINNPRSSFSVKLNNVNMEYMRQMTKNMADKHNMISGQGISKYGTTFYGCQGYAARSLARVGIPTLPINLLPQVLTFQLLIRQAAIYASPILTR